MDENNSNNRNNPPSQRSKAARVARGAVKVGAKSLQYGTPTGLAYTAIKSITNNPDQQPPPVIPTPAPNTSEQTESSGQESSPQDNTAAKFAKGVGKVGLKTLQYTTPTGLAYTAGRAAINKARGATPATTSEDTAPAATETEPTPTSTQRPSRTKAIGKKALKTQGKVLMYTTPGGFLIGKFGPRLKERFFGKKTIEDILRDGETSKASTITKQVGPKKPSRFQAFKKTKLWKIGTAPIKYGTLGGLFYVGAKKLKAKQKGAPSSTAEKATGKPTVHTNIPTALPAKKWLDYQKIWNNSRIKKAIDRGYNRFTLLQKIRNSKTAQTVWKYGKYVALSPTGGAAIDMYSHHRKKEAHKKEAVAQPPSNKSTEKYADTTLWSGYGSSNTPSPGIGKRVYNRFITPRMSSLNSRLGRKIGNRAISRGAASAGQQIASQAAKQVAQTAAQTFLKTPAGWITVGVIILIILIIALIITIITSITGGGGSGDSVGGGVNVGVPVKDTNPIVGLTLTKTASPTILAEPGEITYTVSYSFTPPASSTVTEDDITIFDAVPENTTLVADKTTGNFTLDASGKVLSWALSDPINKTLNSFSFTVIPTTTNVVISNTAYALADASLATAPTIDTCSGIYTLSPQGNFGDPGCTFTKDQLYTALKTQDPQNADYWYLKIVPCESGYSPNAYLAASQSGLGAYGLFQMNPLGRGNGVYDAGNVDWPLQISNAINYNRLINNSFAYWACR